MDKDRVAGSAKKIKGSIKEVVGKTAGNAKLEAEGKADKVEGKVQSAVGGLKDKATSQRKTSQRVSQSASPPSHTRLAKPSRSRRSSDGSHVTETDLISDILPPAAAERRPRQRYGDWGDHVPMFLLHSGALPSAPPPRAGAKSLIFNHSSSLINPLRASYSSPVHASGKSSRPRRFTASWTEI